MNEIKIHDIKGLVEIPDISLYLYMALWILGIALIFVIIFFIFRYFYNKNRNERKNYYKILKDLDLNNTKQSAYTISKYSRLLVTNPKEEKLCEELIDVLKNYKYKKEVEPLNDEVKIVFGRFMDNIDV
jgi:hypothetical protein